jgi:hypothetical protein
MSVTLATPAKDKTDKSPASTTFAVTMSRAGRERPDSAGEGSRAAKAFRISGIAASPSQGRAIRITARIGACTYEILQRSSSTRPRGAKQWDDLPKTPYAQASEDTPFPKVGE